MFRQNSQVDHSLSAQKSVIHFKFKNSHHDTTSYTIQNLQVGHMLLSQKPVTNKVVENLVYHITVEIKV